MPHAHTTTFQRAERTGLHATTLNGQFLADRESDGKIVQLLCLSNYYVERHYDPAENRSTRHKAFADMSRLVPYIAHIKFNLR